MGGGLARDGAVQDQIDDTVADAVPAARAGMTVGESADHCAICGDDILEARRRAVPRVRTCVPGRSGRDQPLGPAINRCGSKDSPLP